MSNALASFVAAITPRLPISTEHADVIRSKVSDTVHQLAAEVSEYLNSLPAEGDALLPKEEQVIIITSPPPPP